MITFDTAITEAKQTIQNWSGYAGLSEVTIIRDVFGKLSFWFSGTGSPDKSSLAVALHGQLGDYDAQHIFWAGESYNDLTQMLLQEVQARRHFDSRDGNCVWYLLERTIAKKAWLDYNGQVTPIWPYEDAESGRRPKIVTFTLSKAEWAEPLLWLPQLCCWPSMVVMCWPLIQILKLLAWLHCFSMKIRFSAGR